MCQWDHYRVHYAPVGGRLALSIRREHHGDGCSEDVNRVGIHSHLLVSL